MTPTPHIDDPKPNSLADTLRQIAGIISSSLDLQEVLQQVLEQVHTIIPYDMANIMLLDGDIARVRIGKGYQDPQAVERIRFDVREMHNLRQIMETLQPIVIPDTTTDPNWVRVPPSENVCSWVSAPLVVRDRVIGFLSLDALTPGYYGPQHAAILATFAPQAGIAIQNARLYEEAERRAAQLRTINEIGRDLATVLDTQVLFQRAVSLIRETYDHYAVNICVLDGGELRMAAMDSVPEVPRVPPGYIIEKRKGIMWWVVEHGEALLVSDVNADPRFLHYKGIPLTASELAVPIRLEGDSLGVLDVQSNRPNVYDQTDVDLLTILADQLAVAIRTARLYEASQRRLRQLTALQEVSLEVGDSLDLPTVLGAICGSALQLVNADDVHIFLYDDEHDELQFGAGMLRDGKLLEKPATPPRQDGPTHTIARTGQILLVNDPLHHPLYGPEQVMLWNLKAIVGLPLMHGGHVVGAFFAACTRNPHSFTPEEIGLLELLAERASAAIENAHLYETSQRRLRQLTALQEASLEAGDSLDLPTVLDAIAGSALRLVDADDVHIFLYDAERDELQFGTGMLQGGKPLEVPLATPRPDGVTYTTARTGQPLFINDPLHHPLYGPEKVASWGLKAIVSLPLKHGGRVVGVLSTACTRPHTFTPDEISVLQLLAERASAAIENAQLVERLRHTEEQTRDLNEELRQRLKELQQAQARLVQSEKLAAVGQLVSGVAHELNNPLTIVIGYAQLMLQDGALPAELRQDAQRIYDAAARSAEIVHNLLTFSRQRKPKRVPTNVNEVINEALSLRRYQLEVENIELVCDLDPTLLPIMANSFRLQEVVLNLVINGEQAMLETQRGGRLMIRSHRGPGVVRIEVEDTGPGIPKDVLPRIFEPFFTTKEVGQGTGLGLSICYGIVEEHGGRIWAESRQGTEDHGTTFIVELPVGEKLSNPVG